MENKSCRQETAVRTVAQTLGGIAVFRSDLQYLYLYLYFQVVTSVFEFNIVEIQLQSLTIVFPQGDPGSVVSRNCRDTCWPLSLRCLQCNVTNSKKLPPWAWQTCRCARLILRCLCCTVPSSRESPPSSAVSDLVLLLSKNHSMTLIITWSWSSKIN